MSMRVCVVIFYGSASFHFYSLEIETAGAISSEVT